MPEFQGKLNLSQFLATIFSIVSPHQDEVGRPLKLLIACLQRFDLFNHLYPPKLPLYVLILQGTSENFEQNNQSQPTIWS